MKKTNRTFKRFAAITSASLLAACAVAPVATGITSSAVEGEITFKEELGTNHTYTAIKVFSGTAQSNALIGGTTPGKAKLDGLDWAVEGANATEKQAAVADFLAALANSSVLKTGETADFKANMTAADVAGVLATYDSNSDKAIAFAEIVVANKAIFNKKYNSVNGKISVAEDGYFVIEETTSVFGEAAAATAYILGVYDASNGTEVTVKSAIPSFEKKIKDKNDTEGVETEWQDSADYDIGDSIPFKLEATLPSNYDAYDSYKLIFHDTLGEGLTYNGDAKLYIADTEFAITKAATNDCGNTGCLEFVIEDLKQIKGNVNQTPVEANANETVYIEFTATLNDNAVIGAPGNWNDAKLEYSNNPNVGASGTTSETPVDSVVAFTYKTVINKINGTTKEELTGADFKLEKKVKKSDGELEWIVINRKTGTTAGSTFTFTGLDDGEYKLTETATPANFNTIKPMYFKIEAEHVIDITNIADKDNDILGEVKGTDMSGSYADESTAISLGQLKDDEQAPVSGGLVATVENYSGAELPGTGGIGTTIFYLGGGAMAAIGGVYLISKRRMKKSEE